MKLFQRFIAMIAVFCGFGLTSPAAFAHGERSLEPFVRMRTIQWYDVAFSNAQVAVNEPLVITGRFHVAEDWPNNIPEPELVYLGVISPGPVFVRKERYINGEAHLNSLPLEIGRDYEFKMVLKARIPGKYHIHPSFNVKETGNIAGPGQWIEITGSVESFANPIETLQGKTIDLETYGTAAGVRWHMFWMAVAVAWLVWWLRRPLFIPRYNLVQSGAEDKLVSKTDVTLAKGLLIGVPLIVLAGYIHAIGRYDETIPLQTPIDRIAPLPKQPEVVTAKVQRAVYNVSDRAMTLTILVSNQGENPLQLGELSAGSVRFINPRANVDAGDYPEEYLAKTALAVQPDTAIPAGESVELRVIAQDAAWEIERLSSVIRDTDSRFGGLLFFYDAEGNRYQSSVASPLIPKF